MNGRFKVGSKVRRIGTDICFTVEEVQGSCIWSSKLPNAYFTSRMDGVVRKNWYNASPDYIESAEPIPITYRMDKHRMI